jgi:hypothetical protein
MPITKLEPGETMAQIRRQHELDRDCALVARAIDRKPGIPGKAAIALDTGLTPERVHQCIRFINSNESTHQRVDYGKQEAKGGPFAGQIVYGWFPTQRAPYADVIAQSHSHKSKVLHAVRRSQLVQLAYARGLGTAEANAAVVTMEADLGVSIGELSATNFEAFEELYAERFEEVL